MRADEYPAQGRRELGARLTRPCYIQRLYTVDQQRSNQQTYKFESKLQNLYWSTDHSVIFSRIR